MEAVKGNLIRYIREGIVKEGVVTASENYGVFVEGERYIILHGEYEIVK